MAEKKIKVGILGLDNGNDQCKTGDKVKFNSSIANRGCIKAEEKKMKSEILAIDSGNDQCKANIEVKFNK